MSDDFGPKLEQIKEMLNKPGMEDNIKNLMSVFPTNNSSSSNNSGFDDEMINKVRMIMEKKSQLNDPRLNLLNAIKPYLGQKRQQKIDSYSKILNITVLSNLFNDLN